MAKKFATSFNVERDSFDQTYSDVLASNEALLLVAATCELVVGYCLAFDHPAFFANGRVTWVEEIMVTEGTRRSGVGRKLMVGVEDWAVGRNAGVVALATRRAAPFYLAMGYEESAIYFRKVLLSA